MAALSPSDAISAAILYGDIFHYPLTYKELWRWSVGYPVSAADVFGYTQGNECPMLYYVRSKHWHVAKRLVRSNAAKTKWQQGQQISWWISLIPTVLFVGVTGGLSCDNADPDDDIDLCIVTASHTLWITRLFVTILVELVARRRRPGDTQVVDAICLNLFFSRKGMALPVSSQNLYIAHEVLQMVPLFDRGGIYHEFLRMNSWVSSYLPNAWAERQPLSPVRGNSFFQYVAKVISFLGIVPLMFCEKTAQYVQVWYMRKRRTIETVTDENIAFHPRDVTQSVKKAWLMRGKRYQIPLDKVFVLPLK